MITVAHTKRGQGWLLSEKRVTRDRDVGGHHRLSVLLSVRAMFNV